MNDRSSRIEALLKLAGERDQPSAAATGRARAAARESWQKTLRTPGPTPSRSAWAWSWPRIWIAVAGVALLAVVLWPRDPVPVIEVAQVAALDGDVRVAGNAASASTVLHTGEMLSTGEGRVALAVGDALSLRVDRGTRLRFEGVDRVTLIEGALYVDSGGLNAHTALRIETTAGRVRHVGTQFQVAVRAAGTRVQVREGRVVFDVEDGASLDLGAGDQADVSQGQVKLLHGQSASGSAWAWVAAVAPRFDIENRPLSEFLAWLAREQGWQVRYADATVQSRARDIRLHGRLEGLETAALLERVALITGLSLVVDEGTLHVGRSP